MLADDAACPADKLELVVPFLEGLDIAQPASALPETGYAAHDLAYPGEASAPFVAYHCGDGVWTAAYATPLDAIPVHVRIAVEGRRTKLELACAAPCTIHTLRTEGAWQVLARALSAAWDPRPAVTPLVARHRELHYYVHRWIAVDDPTRPLRTDWDARALVDRIRAESPETIAFVYGLDPGGVDLGGRYLWGEGAADTLTAITRSSPGIALYSWLNLRTYKYAVPALGLTRPLTPAIRAQAKLYADGVNDIAQYSFKALEMCLGSASWQADRFAELVRLVTAGYKVIALDEFPTAPRWHGEACRAEGHLHPPGDAVAEGRVTLAFVARLAAYAREHGVLLSSEEPSAALLPYVSGYMDGAFNDPPEMYELYVKSHTIRPIPFYSAMFGGFMTPCTRPAPKADAPSGWLTMRKVTTSGFEPPR